MINKKSIDKFLRRRLESFDWLKSASSTEVDHSIKELDSKTDLSKLWKHQKVCLLILESLQRFMLHVDMGGGKTATVLSLIRHRKQNGEKPKAVVFVPYITAVETWIDECEKHAPDLVCVPLIDSTANNLHQLSSSDGDLFVICYQSAVAMLAESVPSKRKSKKKWTIDPNRTRTVFGSFDMLVMDEVHKCKSVSSLTYRMCRSISARTPYAIGLTGTPFGKDLTDLWPQFYLIDFGETLGETLGFYREVFFKQSKNYWGGFKYKFQKKLYPKLQKMIKNISIRYAIDELHDMPKMLPVFRMLEAPEGAAAYAKKAIQSIKDTVGNKGTNRYRVVESEYLRLRQLASGFMTLKGEDNNKIQIKFDANPKLDILEELVDSMPLDCKMVVFHHFVYTNELISAKLKEMKIGHARVWGKQKDPIGEIQRFKRDEKCRVLVINSKSGSSALNLQVANYIVFFEQPDSPIDRQQAEKRVWRPGQLKRVLLYDFLMKGTADTKLYKSNKAGRNLLQMLLDGSTQL